ncbi:monoglyceride lipase-like isoform X2 [Ornithodoros turicata]|uniref:monoglyceride lipase-like isoform X2 n=1 Tax=Ornithodoros turicata TaxID=34597 RepID=UPI003139F912
MTTVTTSMDNEGSFRNKDGFNIFCRYWKPEGAPKALLFLSHGYAEHCHDPRYDDLAKELSKHGFFVFAHDHVGHGKSEGPRGICSSVGVYVTDVLTHVDMMKGRHPGLPMFIYGHSMGGLVAALTLVQRPTDFSAAVLSAPLLATDKAQTSWLQMTLARVLGRLVPSLPIGSLVMSNAVKDPEVVTRMNEDPLRYHGYIRAGWAAAILEALDVYKDCYHGLLHEPDGVGDQILQFTVSWCVERIAPADTS